MDNNIKIENLVKCLDRENKILAILENNYNKNEIIIAYSPKDYIKGYDESFLDQLNYLTEKYKQKAFGYISYDSVKFWEKLKDISKPIENWPYAEFFIPEETIYIKDNVIEQKINKCETDEVKVDYYDSSLGKEEYKEKVKTILDYIHRGYAFQVVLSRFYRYSYNGDPINIYLKLRKISPSPYLYYLKFYNRILIGASPELLFELYNNNIVTYPIAGTRERGIDEESDKKLENELLNSEKDNAEHLMLLDLARNDIGKVSIPGTVNVPKSFYIQKFSHVQHIVSKVTGKIDKNRDLSYIIKSLFPAGTVSGAPKPFAMNLIDELEIYKRGPYAGVVGYVSNKDTRMALSIRSIYINNEIMRIQAGAGIVYDSMPELEYIETEQKLKALKISLGVI
ncbi:chorismate-binding protein [Caldisphaera sp.]|uniref:chorismate-binding protein n=1 Tax=Caldisphaera sp. TaxID=2060322 RepID=UPI0025C0960D|nr:chorismate-binding protein [Caldisphaera sp.]